MPYLTKYHLSEQHASVLLGPVADAVAELERRTRHYAERLAMSPADREALLAAGRALATAHEQLARIRQGGAAAADEAGYA
jgi:hypothetical protein